MNKLIKWVVIPCVALASLTACGSDEPKQDEEPTICYLGECHDYLDGKTFEYKGEQKTSYYTYLKREEMLFKYPNFVLVIEGRLNVPYPGESVHNKVTVKGTYAYSNGEFTDFVPTEAILEDLVKQTKKPLDIAKEKELGKKPLVNEKAGTITFYHDAEDGKTEEIVLRLKR